MCVYLLIYNICIYVWLNYFSILISSQIILTYTYKKNAYFNIVKNWYFKVCQRSDRNQGLLCSTTSLKTTGQNDLSAAPAPSDAVPKTLGSYRDTQERGAGWKCRIPPMHWGSVCCRSTAWALLFWGRWAPCWHWCSALRTALNKEGCAACHVKGPDPACCHWPASWQQSCYRSFVGKRVCPWQMVTEMIHCIRPQNHSAVINLFNKISTGYNHKKKPSTRYIINTRFKTV